MCMYARVDVEGEGVRACVRACVISVASELSQVNGRGINVEFTPSGQGTKNLISAYNAAGGSSVCVYVCVVLQLF